MHKQQIPSRTIQREFQRHPRMQQILSRMRNPTSNNQARNVPTLLKKIQIDPQSRTVSIKSHGQPHIILKSRRGLRLRIHGKGRQPTKVINVMFQNRQSAQQQGRPQNLQSNVRPSSLFRQQNTADHTGQKNAYTLALGQSNAQNRQEVGLQTGSGQQVRILGDARATLEYLIRHKLLSYNFQQPVSDGAVGADKVNTKTQMPLAGKINITTVSYLPSTTSLPLDYETEEPDYPMNA